MRALVASLSKSAARLPPLSQYPHDTVAVSSGTWRARFDPCPVSRALVGGRELMNMPDNFTVTYRGQRCRPDPVAHPRQERTDRTSRSSIGRRTVPSAASSSLASPRTISTVRGVAATCAKRRIGRSRLLMFKLFNIYKLIRAVAVRWFHEPCKRQMPDLLLRFARGRVHVAASDICGSSPTPPRSSRGTTPVVSMRAWWPEGATAGSAPIPEFRSAISEDVDIHRVREPWWLHSL